MLPLDDLLVVTRELINPAVSRSGLDRCLQRHGMGSLRDLQAKAAGESEAPPKSFKDYVPGFVHVDIKYLPQMPDEKARRYLFVAIDRATRWVCLRIYARLSGKPAPVQPEGLAFHGAAIRDRDQNLSLTDMWKAAGSPESKRPNDWLATPTARDFIEFVGENLNAGEAKV